MSKQFNLEGCLFRNMDGNKVFLTDQVRRHFDQLCANHAPYTAGDAVDAAIAAAMYDAKKGGDFSAENVLDNLKYIHSQLGTFIENLKEIV
ncbi:MAG: hypothetical protein FMNOHCHN_03493 [Ignavibacteriaceae bacterium]|nr:hypothetical protein [Ignavibacteriaceae bacterium]